MDRQEIIRRLRTGKFSMDDCLNLPFNVNKMDAGRVVAEIFYELYRVCGGSGIESTHQESLNNIADVLEEFWEE